VLDGCDGELARIRFQESKIGAVIDFWGDNLVHLALFSCLAAGLYRSTGSSLCLLLGASASAGIVGSAALAFRQKLGPVERALAQRDFIYLLLVMAFWRVTYYFLWAGAVGAPLFLALILAARKPAPEPQGARA
jgi:1L-myo-inositol 1-phosphate cytidylyltransferase / CDP-L-myo-inositol myo-inositolphosphotransferase